MNVYVIQQSIVAKLNADFESVSVPFSAFDLPDAQNDFQKAVAAPIVYVVYTGSKPDLSISSNVIAQPRKISFSVEIHSRSLYKANGLFVARDLVEQSLIGFMPANCQRIYLIKDDITKTDDGIWVHVMQLECQTMLVQKDYSDPVVVPSFKELSFSDGE